MKTVAFTLGGALLFILIGAWIINMIRFERTHICTQAHDEMYLQIIQTGNGTNMFIPQQMQVCDHWVPKP